MPESRFANGNVTPSCFVKISNTSAVGRVILCSANTDKIFGISQPGTRQPPYTGLDDGYCAIAGEAMLVYTFPDKEVYLTLGSGGCNAGDRLTADASGFGVVTTTTGQEVGAVAKQSGNSGDLVPVDLLSPGQY